MSILDKSFMRELFNPPPKFTKFKDYNKYMSGDIKNILNAKLLSFLKGESSSIEQEVCLLYQFEDKYIVIEIHVGTSSRYISNTEKVYDNNLKIDNIIERSYVSTNYREVETYILKRYDHDNDYCGDINYIYPDNPMLW